MAFEASQRVVGRCWKAVTFTTTEVLENQGPPYRPQIVEGSALNLPYINPKPLLKGALQGTQFTDTAKWRHPHVQGGTLKSVPGASLPFRSPPRAVRRGRSLLSLWRAQGSLIIQSAPKSWNMGLPDAVTGTSRVKERHYAVARR